MTKRDKRYVIIGNGVAGTTAAETLRKLDPNCSIHVLTNEPYPLYNRVSLPRFLQGVIGEQKVMMHDFAWHEQRTIQLVTESMVTDVDTEERVVVTDTGEHLPYDALLVATGGWANPLRVPGAEGTKHIYNFVTLDDARTIIARMQESRTAVAYGGSFIAYELCDGFARRKLDTTCFSIPAVREGVVADLGPMRLARLIGTARAKYLCLLGRRFSAQEGLALGIIHEVVAPAKLEQHALNMAQELLSIPFTALRHTKRQIDRAFEQDVATLTNEMVAAQEDCLCSPEHAEVMVTYCKFAHEMGGF